MSLVSIGFRAQDFRELATEYRFTVDIYKILAERQVAYEPAISLVCCESSTSSWNAVHRDERKLGC